MGVRRNVVRSEVEDGRAISEIHFDVDHRYSQADVEPIGDAITEEKCGRIARQLHHQCRLNDVALYETGRIEDLVKQVELDIAILKILAVERVVRAVEVIRAERELSFAKVR